MTQAWNPAQAGSFLTFSNGNLTVTKNTQIGDDIACGITSVTSGFYYWEVSITGATGVGVGNITTRAISGDYLGEFTSDLGWYNDGRVLNNAGGVIATWATYSAPITLCLALDLTNHKIWGRVGASGNWNNDVIGNQNPATNTGGLTLPANVYAAAVVPGVNLNTLSPPDTATGVFAAGSWIGTAPDGFSGFDGPAVKAWPRAAVSF